MVSGAEHTLGVTLNDYAAKVSSQFVFFYINKFILPSTLATETSFCTEYQLWQRCLFGPSVNFKEP